MDFKRRAAAAVLAVVLVWMAGAAVGRAEGFTALRGATLIANAANDGDSFHVMADGRHLLVRLYFVDCPETSALAATDARRLGEQMRYFGLPGVVDTVHFGKAAAAFTTRALSAPFTLYTTFAAAPGRSSIPRTYGFIETADGKDLASLLVGAGLARPYGVRRQTPQGVPHDEMRQRLEDLELSAVLKRSGIWAASDPERIAELRAAQRAEDRRLSEIQRQVREHDGPGPKALDLNAASAEELATIKGIGPALAERIIAGRPYASVEDLAGLKGIGAGMMETLREALIVTSP